MGIATAERPTAIAEDFRAEFSARCETAIEAIIRINKLANPIPARTTWRKATPDERRDIIAEVDAAIGHHWHSRLHPFRRFALFCEVAAVRRANQSGHTFPRATA